MTTQKDQSVTMNKGRIRKISRYIINTLCWCGVMLLCFVALQIGLFSSFKIPGNSMEPELIAGDYVLVNKLTPGARIFNIFRSIRGEQVDLFRLPGTNKIKRNDVIVFNYPYPNSWDKLEMNILKYYIKRCIGLPGDSVSIRNGYYKIQGLTQSLGSSRGQNKLSRQDNQRLKEMNLYWSFPEDSLLGWNVKNFGPLYIPGKGDTIDMSRRHLSIYRKLIEWETQQTLSIDENGTIALSHVPISTYTFRTNYYFVAGDRVEDSQDSRYWGLLPESFIVGKAFLIWKSTDPLTESMRWNRVLRDID